MIYNFLQNLFTRNKTKIPLFIVYFNHKKYKESGKENSCLVAIDPTLANDEFIKHYTKIIVDYIAETYNLEEL